MEEAKKDDAERGSDLEKLVLLKHLYAEKADKEVLQGFTDDMITDLEQSKSHDPLTDCTSLRPTENHHTSHIKHYHYWTRKKLIEARNSDWINVYSDLKVQPAQFETGRPRSYVDALAHEGTKKTNILKQQSQV